MEMQAYVDEIKLNLTGGVLQLEIGDDIIERIVQSAMRQMQRYICSTKLITIPYQKCIDLSPYKVNAVARVYRASAAGIDAASDSTGLQDPVQIGLIQVAYNSGNMYNFSDYVSNYLSYSTMQQMRNTVSTDLAFFYEDDEKRLYINTTLDSGSYVTIEYVPRYDSVDEIKSDFWIDVLMRLSLALTKIHVGRIRTRFTQSNALWTQDGEQLLSEGNSELTALQEYLQKNTQLLYPLD